jgi:hypothetical protein
MRTAIPVTDASLADLLDAVHEVSLTTTCRPLESQRSVDPRRSAVKLRRELPIALHRIGKLAFLVGHRSIFERTSFAVVLPSYGSAAICFELAFFTSIIRNRLIFEGIDRAYFSHELRKLFDLNFLLAVANRRISAVYFPTIWSFY